MATDDPKPWHAVEALPAQRWVSLIEAFPRVKAAVGGSDVLAAHDLTMKLRAGKLSAAGRQIAPGEVDRCFIFARECWLRVPEIDPPFRAAEALQLLEARNPLPKGRGHWWFFFDRKQFDKLYPPAVPSAPKGSCAQDLIRRIAADEWPGGYEHVGTAAIIKRVGDKLQEMDGPVPKRDVFLRALGRRKG